MTDDGVVILIASRVGRSAQIEVLEDLWNSPDWKFKRGERRLMDLTARDPDKKDISMDEPGIAEYLGAQLDQWMGQQGLTGGG